MNNKQVMGILNITPDSFYDGGRYESILDLLVGTNGNYILMRTLGPPTIIENKP